MNETENGMREQNGTIGSTVGERIRALRTGLRMSQTDLAAAVGFKERSAICNIETGRRELTQSTLSALCRALGTDPNYLLFGIHRDTEGDGAGRSGEWDNRQRGNLAGLSGGTIRLAPVFESVSAGFGVDALDEAVDYMPVYAGTKAEAEDTILIKVKGDSMEPLIADGDIVQVWKTPFAENGSVAVVIADTDAGNEAFVKKLFVKNGGVELQSLNPAYAPMVFTGADARGVRIVGVVRKVIKTLREPCAYSSK